MTWLSIVLVVKIAVTGLLVAAPFMFSPKYKLEKLLGIAAPTPALFRLYGVAIAALLVGYGFGVAAAEAGRFPWGVVCMGIVSNGGAALVLLTHSRDSMQGRALAVFFASMALALIVAAIAPVGAIAKAW